MAPTRRKKPLFHTQFHGDRFTSASGDLSNKRQDVSAFVGDLPDTSTGQRFQSHPKRQHSNLSSAGHLGQHIYRYRNRQRHHNHQHHHPQQKSCTMNYITRSKGRVQTALLPRMSVVLTAMVVLFLALPGSGDSLPHCPRPCSCISRGFVDCSFRNLNVVPRGIPKHVQRL
ncbi:matrix-remodeling-associated protein 5, partial [Plakobranchus ocellatus]